MEMKKIKRVAIAAITMAVLLSGCGVRVKQRIHKQLNVKECRYEYEVKTYIWHNSDIVSSMYSRHVFKEDLEAEKASHDIWAEEEKAKVLECIENLR